MEKFKSLIKEIPLPIRLFLGKALLLYIIWEILYGLFIYDSKYIDRFLTTHVGESSVIVLNSLGNMNGFTSKDKIYNSNYDGEEVTEFFSEIYHNNRKVLNIANGCNGLSLMVLYIGFIICIPGTFWRKMKYVILGLVLLDCINILRCVGLIYLREYFHAYFDFAHHYVFKAVVYASTFIIWVTYARKTNKPHETLQNG